MRLMCALAIVMLGGCATNSKCNYAARPVGTCGSSIDFDSGKLYVNGPACSKVKIRLEACGTEVGEKWLENVEGHQWTGKATWGCEVSVVDGSCRQYPLRANPTL